MINVLNGLLLSLKKVCKGFHNQLIRKGLSFIQVCLDLVLSQQICHWILHTFYMQRKKGLNFKGENQKYLMGFLNFPCQSQKSVKV